MQWEIQWHDKAIQWAIIGVTKHSKSMPIPFSFFFLKENTTPPAMVTKSKHKYLFCFVLDFYSVFWPDHFHLRGK